MNTHPVFDLSACTGLQLLTLWIEHSDLQYAVRSIHSLPVGCPLSCLVLHARCLNWMRFHVRAWAELRDALGTEYRRKNVQSFCVDIYTPMILYVRHPSLTYFGDLVEQVEEVLCPLLYVIGIVIIGRITYSFGQRNIAAYV